MGKIADQINADLKRAMLAGDKRLTGILRDAKSALLYGGVDSGNRDDMSDQQEMAVLRKEVKKRADAMAIYQKAADDGRYQEEQFEKTVLEGYLPRQMSEEKINLLIDQAINDHGELSSVTMGKVIGQVKQTSAGQADGAVIAKLVKERL